MRDFFVKWYFLRSEDKQQSSINRTICTVTLFCFISIKTEKKENLSVGEEDLMKKTQKEQIKCCFCGIRIRDNLNGLNYDVIFCKDDFKVIICDECDKARGGVLTDQ